MAFVVPINVDAGRVRCDAVGVADIALFVTVKFEQPVTSSEEQSIGGLLRPEDGEMCIWVDEYDPRLLQVSTAMNASSLTAGLDAARQLADEVVDLCPAGAALYGVVAADEEGQLSVDE